MEATVKRRGRKLARWLKDPELAEELADAGLSTPKRIKRATNKQIEKVVGKSRSIRGRGKHG